MLVGLLTAFCSGLRENKKEVHWGYYRARQGAHLHTTQCGGRVVEGK